MHREQDNKEQMYVSQLSIVDLAGSERTARTNAVGLQLKEAGANAALYLCRHEHLLIP